MTDTGGIETVPTEVRLARRVADAPATRRSSVLAVRSPRPAGHPLKLSGEGPAIVATLAGRVVPGRVPVGRARASRPVVPAAT